MNKVNEAKINLGEDSSILGGSRKRTNNNSRAKSTTNTNNKNSHSKSKAKGQNSQNESFISNGNLNNTLSQNNSYYSLKEAPTNITELIEKNMKKLNDSQNWQNRKESCENIIRYFSSQSPSMTFYMDNLNDFLTILRNRICDPNKQLIRSFVSLIGWVFQFLSEKEVKINARNFVQSLCEVFTDKSEVNRK